MINRGRSQRGRPPWFLAFVEWHRPFGITPLREGKGEEESGAEGARTLDPKLAKLVLSQLSYRPSRMPPRIFSAGLSPSHRPQPVVSDFTSSVPHF